MEKTMIVLSMKIIDRQTGCFRPWGDSHCVSAIISPADHFRTVASHPVEVTRLRALLVTTFAIFALFPIWASGTWYSLGTLEEWKPRIQSALKYIEVEHDEDINAIPVEDRVAAIYLIAYLEGIRDGSWFNGAIAYYKKYGEGADFDPEKEIDLGFCLDDPYFEIVPILDKHIVEANYAEETEFLDVLMRFLESEYACE